MTQEKPQYITTAEAARLLHVTPRRIRAMIEAKQIPAERLGRDWVIDANELHRRGLQFRKPGRPRKAT